MRLEACVPPRRLRPGDRVAVVAPASPVDPAKLAAGLAVIRRHDLEPVLGPNVRRLRATGIYAAPLPERAAELNGAFEDDSVAGVFVAGGGFGSAQLLPSLRWDLAAAGRKPLMGFSDVTALNCALLARAGLRSIHGPCVEVRVEDGAPRAADVTALEDALALLLAPPGPWGARPFARNPNLTRCVCPGEARGPAVGGNLTTFACLLGTPYLPPLEGAVLFLEDVDEGGYELARTLTHLKLAGVFDAVAGVVFGELSRCPRRVEPVEPSVDEVLVEFFADGPPCAMAFDFAHGDTQAAIPIGTEARLDATNATVEFGDPFG